MALIKEKNISYTATVHKKVVKAFKEIHLDYSTVHNINNLTYIALFYVMIDFMLNYYQSEKILRPCPIAFKEAVNKQGNRKRNKRSFATTELAQLSFKVKESYLDFYFHLMYSFILNEPSEDEFSEYHSKNYFFYDFINFQLIHKKELLQFRPHFV